jgi:hypothetical protein
MEPRNGSLAGQAVSGARTPVLTRGPSSSRALVRCASLQTTDCLQQCCERIRSTKEEEIASVATVMFLDAALRDDHASNERVIPASASRAAHGRSCAADETVGQRDARNDESVSEPETP